jgi:serine/threonine protein kinase
MNIEAPKAKSIFLAAIELRRREEWPGYIAEACGEDHELRRRVEGLLEAHVVTAGAVDRFVLRPERTIDYPSSIETPGSVIGPYKLLEQIGEGGMGQVFMAEQTAPVRRKVALKIIKPGMDSKQVIARFEAERQALAMMDHPNIARVLDAGATESGRPYFVMELVRGIPITEYCDQVHLSIPERLDLFVLVCRAVQHAHQ